MAEKERDVKSVEEGWKNPFDEDVIVYRVFLDGHPIGVFNDPYWASYFIERIKEENFEEDEGAPNETC